MPLLPRREDPHDRRGHGRGAADGHRPRARRLNRRAAAIWIALFAVYAATLGLNAFGRSEYAGDEPHYLLIAKSIVDSGDVDLTDAYAERSYSSFYPYPLDPHGVPTKGRLDERHGVGFPLLIAPAYAIAGAKGVEVFLAALAALAVALAYLLALRVVPDPWALGSALAVGLSPPLLAWSTAIYPELAAAAVLCGAALLALRLAERPSRPLAWGCFGLLALLPWLGLQYALAGAAIGVYGYRALRRQRRAVLALASAEIVGFSAALYVGLSEGLFGGPTPYSADAPGHSATGAAFPLGYLDRAYRLVALFIDREYGLLRWAPVFALAFAGAWVLARGRRSGLARAIPELRGEQAAATLCGAAGLAQLLVAAFAAPTMFGFWFPARHLVAALPLSVPLVALGMRRAPRVGTLLALIGAAGSLWLYLYVRLGDGGLVAGRPPAPFGPLKEVLPLFARSSTYPFVLAGAIGGAAVVLAALAWRGSPRSARAG